MKFFFFLHLFIGVCVGGGGGGGVGQEKLTDPIVQYIVEFEDEITNLLSKLFLKGA